MSLSVIPESGIQFRSRISYGFNLKHPMTRMTWHEVSARRAGEDDDRATYFGFTIEKRRFCVEDLVELWIIEIKVVLVLLCLAFEVRHRGVSRG